MALPVVHSRSDYWLAKLNLPPATAWRICLSANESDIYVDAQNEQ